MGRVCRKIYIVGELFSSRDILMQKILGPIMGTSRKFSFDRQTTALSKSKIVQTGCQRRPLTFFHSFWLKRRMCIGNGRIVFLSCAKFAFRDVISGSDPLV